MINGLTVTCTIIGLYVPNGVKGRYGKAVGQHAILEKPCVRSAELSERIPSLHVYP